MQEFSKNTESIDFKFVIYFQYKHIGEIALGFHEKMKINKTASMQSGSYVFLAEKLLLSTYHMTKHI